MADTFIPSTNGGFGTLITDGYAKTLHVAPDPPEPPRQKDRHLTRRDLKKFGLKADGDVAELVSMDGFPKAAQRLPFGEWTVTLVWSENLVDRWAADQRARATRILELLG